MYSTLWNIRNTLINNIPRRFEFSEIEHASQIRKNALDTKAMNSRSILCQALYIEWKTVSH